MNGNLIPFYNNWRFLRTELNTTMGELERQKTRFSPVELPHDWLIYDAKDLYRNGCGWYRKEFELVTGEIEDLSMELGWDRTVSGTGKDGVERITARIGRGEKVILRFDGVYMDSTVYVNGIRIGDWKYGYSTFDMDVTNALVCGNNVITVQVRHQAPNSRWYSGAGIYRKVWLKVCPAVYLPLDGTYVTTHSCEGGFGLDIETEVSGKLDPSIGCHYQLMKDNQIVQDLGWHSVTAMESALNGNQSAESGQAAGQVALAVPGRVTVHALVENPQLWDIENPKLYRLRVDLCRKDREEVVIDNQEITVGFRTITLTCDKGLFLNGRHVKIHGVCEHHDLGCLGAAFHVPAMERKIRMLKTMGVNAIRTSHNMPAPELMDLADRMGILILSEGFDMWERCKTEYDYGRFFREWCERDVRSWVRRDRNHPSLLLWSIGNEIYDTHADAHGQEITKRLMSAVRENDPGENALITIGSNYMPWENARKCADLVKVAGYNYGETCYEKQHREHPDWMMYGSETASLVQSRGIYHFPLQQSVLCDEDEQCSSLGNSATSWGAKSWEKCITDDRDPEYIWGQFIWTGFDYIGEPTPYHTKNSYFGQIDTAGFPKDSYYVYRAEWTDGKKAPMVHLFPYWDFNPGQMIDVCACSNASSIELFVNGKSMGRQEIDHIHGYELIKTWQVPYEPGTIMAVAYDEDGREVARDSHTSFGDSCCIRLRSDKDTMSADCEDMCFIEVSTVDANGNPVENASDYVMAEVSGPGRILGMDNGDSTDEDDYKTNVRKLFSGKLLIIVGSTGEPGEVTVKVTGKGLEPATIRLSVTEIAERRVPSGTAYSVSAGDTKDIVKQSFLEDCAQNTTLLPERIPIRKLELSAPEGTQLGKDKRTVVVEAVLYPAATTDTRLVWKAVNTIGIDVNFVKIKEMDVEGKQCAKVTAIGDGDFYVRCMAVNDKRAILISQMKFEAAGLGRAFLNPYEFVTAGLFTDTFGEIGNGNEKGIATQRDAESGVIYEGVDFGEYGSDTITIPVFALSDEAFSIDIWIGRPHEEGSRLLDTVIYQKPSIWNTYQEETYRLSERLRGITTIALVMRDKVHIKGFVFEKQEKAFGRLTGGDATAIYGDAFQREGSRVRNIGNNVTIVYEGMNFGTKGTDHVTISGRTPLEKNTIHLQFTDNGGESVRRIIEFTGPQQSEEATQTFHFDKITGDGKMELVFLPGSNFDLCGLCFGSV